VKNVTLAPGGPVRRMTAVFCAWLALSSGAAAQLGAPLERLARADAARLTARRHGDAAMMVRSLSEAAAVRGQVFAVDGAPADLDYAAWYAEATAMASRDRGLLERLNALPGPERGEVGGRGPRALRTRGQGQWQGTLTFRGGEAAQIYVRGQGGLTLSVVGPDGQERCGLARRSGKMICTWWPARETIYRVRVSANGGPPSPFEVLVN